MRLSVDLVREHGDRFVLVEELYRLEAARNWAKQRFSVTSSELDHLVIIDATERARKRYRGSGLT